MSGDEHGTVESGDEHGTVESGTGEHRDGEGGTGQRGTGRRRLAVGAWAGLLQVHAALVPALDQLLAQATGLPLSWYDVLLELAAAPGRRLLMGELGERVVLSRTRVSRIVDELAAAGLVRKESNPRDGRSSFAVLTPEGLARYRAAAPVYLAGIEREFAASLTDDELAVIGTALSKVTGQSVHNGIAVGGTAEQREAQACP
ncbi:MAG TPA: MarR family transcriptional regulator [Streptosporangiaceae bacterium]|nr:MarR family transcriptional regulator [Streptosporangiaceae bacterium]